MLHPTKYGDILAKKMREHGSNAYLVNTGWSGGGYGKEPDELKRTRRIIGTIFDGTLESAAYEKFPIFGFEIPKDIDGVPSGLLNPKATWANGSDYDEALKKLGMMFKQNFEKYTDNDAGKALVKVGPKL